MASTLASWLRFPHTEHMTYRFVVTIVLLLSARFALAAGEPRSATGANSAAGVSPAATAAVTDAAVGRAVPPFKAEVIDVSQDPPRPAEFDSQAVKRPTFYAFVGTTCPATQAYLGRFKQLEQEYGPKGVDFVFIYPNSNDTSDAKRAFHRDNKLGGRMIDDKGAHLATLFKAQRTSELFLADKSGMIVYHGAVDDSRDPNTVQKHYVADALNELLAGKPITLAASQVFA
jgi:thiol-disulfide isomerase/thioredoxin